MKMVCQFTDRNFLTSLCRLYGHSEEQWILNHLTCKQTDRKLELEAGQAFLLVIPQVLEDLGVVIFCAQAVGGALPSPPSLATRQSVLRGALDEPRPWPSLGP